MPTGVCEGAAAGAGLLTARGMRMRIHMHPSSPVAAPSLTSTSRTAVQIGGTDDPWKNLPRNLDPNAPHPTNYLRNLHWCMGVMSGYSDGTVPDFAHQYLFTLAVLNIGLFTFAYTVGVIGAMGDGNSQKSREFQIAVSSMKQFVLRYDLPSDFHSRITDYFAHRWESIKSNEKELITAAELLEELPPCVRCAARSAAHKTTRPRPGRPPTLPRPPPPPSRLHRTRAASSARTLSAARARPGHPLLNACPPRSLTARALAIAAGSMRWSA